MSALQKLSEAPKIQLCEDFGQSPLLLAHLTHDRSIIGVISLVGGFVAMAALGLPGAAIVGFAALNDLKYCASTDQGYSDADRTGEQPVTSETVEGNGAIDVPAVTVDGEVKAMMPTNDADDIAKQRQIEYNGFDNGRSPSASDGLFGPHPSSATAQTAIEGARETPIHFVDDNKMVSAAAPSISSAAIASPDYLKTIKSVVSRNSCFFVGGARGAGKGVMVSNLIRWKLDQFPGSIAVWFDPKGSPREDGNFADPRITRLKISGIGMSEEEFAIEVAEQMEIARTFIDRADIENGIHVFFVFDEIMNLKQKLDKRQFKAIQNLLVDCVSMGDDSGIHAISITQSFNAGESVGSDELMKNMALIACLKKDDYPRARKLVQFGKTNHSDLSEEEFNRLVRKSPRNRVLCVGGTFIPAPEMPLLSGWDRDKGSHVDRSSNSSNSTIVETNAIQSDSDDDGSDIPSLMEQAITAMTVSTGEAKARIREAIARSGIEAQSGNPAKSRKILMEALGRG